MQVTLKNDFYEVQLDTHGAELQSIRSQHTGQEYLWQADPQIWKRHAPVLFPIVGKLKDDQYRYQGKTYQMTQHGFARDRAFTVEHQSDSSVTLLLHDDEKTQRVYPFAFELRVKYTLVNRLINVSYHVHNPSDTQTLIFGIGGHPGFQIPLDQGLNFDDYYLQFHPSKSRIQIPLTTAGIDYQKRTLAPTNVNWQLNHEVFQNDALIFQLQGENEVAVRSDKSPHGIALLTKDAPFLGVWSPYPKTGNLICLEPWWGIADLTSANGELTDKYGMNHLAPQAKFRAKYQISIH